MSRSRWTSPTRVLPGVFVVGLPDTAVQEARERVRAAVRNSGLRFPPKRVTVNLAPAEMRKSGPSYDLPIAVGILLATGQVSGDVSKVVFLGELSLDGALRHLQGVLPMVGLARDRGMRTVYVPAVDAAEAALVAGIDVLPIGTLGELVAHLRGEIEIAPMVAGASDGDTLDPEPDLRSYARQGPGARPSRARSGGGGRTQHLALGGRRARARRCWRARSRRSCPA